MFSAARVFRSLGLRAERNATVVSSSHIIPLGTSYICMRRHTKQHRGYAVLAAVSPDTSTCYAPIITRSSLMPQPAKATSFWSSAAFDADYWETYLSYRPKYSTDFYKQILFYHRAHQLTSNTSASIAHDVGTGPGQVAAYFSEHFSHVVASDPNQPHLDFASTQLLPNEQTLGQSQVSLLNCKGEEIAQHCPANSAHLITVAECMPLLDASAALAAWHTVLRPNGTLAIWFYGRPSFVPSDESNSPFTQADAALCNQIFNALATHAWRPIYQMGKLKPGYTGVFRSLTMMDSQLDNVSLDPNIWCDVQRIKFNPDLPMSMSDSADIMDITPVSHIHPSEKVTGINDRTFWSEAWTADGLRNFLTINMPPGAYKEDDAMKQWWRDLQQAMGGSDIRRNVTWSCVLILATKR